MKELLNALQVVTDVEEYDDIVMSIAMLSSAHMSTVSRLKNYLLNEDGSIDEQILLAFGTLGRHNDVASEVVMTIAQILSSSSNNTTNLPFLIHALGNTGSELIIPYVSPFLFTSNDTIQLTAIDALRTVSTDGSVQKLFSTMIDEAVSVDSLMTIVDSLIFPYQSHLYYPEIVRPCDRDDNHELTAIEEELMEKIVNITIEFDDSELYSAVKKYLKYCGTDRALELLKTLSDHYQQYNDGRRAKRSSTTDWSSTSDSFYNLVASHSSRIADKIKYHYHKAYLWTKQLGPSKINAKIAAGGFSGVGLSGYKIFAKGVVKLQVYGRTYEAVRMEFENRFDILTKTSYTHKFVKVAGSVLLQKPKATPPPTPAPKYSPTKPPVYAQTNPPPAPTLPTKNYPSKSHPPSPPVITYPDDDDLPEYGPPGQVAYYKYRRSTGKPFEKTLKSIKLFDVEFRIFVWIGYLSFYIESNINMDVSLLIEHQGAQTAKAHGDFGPVFSVSGGVSFTFIVSNS